MSKDNNILSLGCLSGDENGEVRIPEGVKEIFVWALEKRRNIKKVILPESLEKIGQFVFRNCIHLEEVQFTGKYSKCTIERGAFEGCSSLKSIVLPEGVIALGNHAFYGCTSLESARAPGLTYIGDSAFEECTALESVNAPAVKHICKSAFEGCKNLRKVNFSNSLLFLGDDAFKDTPITEESFCENVDAIKAESRKTYKISPEYSGVRMDMEFAIALPIVVRRGIMACAVGKSFKDIPLTSIVISEGITTISDYTFCDSNYLEMVGLPSTLKKIGIGAFRDCICLKGVNVPEGVTAINDYTFRGCKELREVVLPKSITSIGKCAFEECTSLKEITIPEGVSVIRGSAFKKCERLSNIVLPNTVEEIEDFAFNECKALHTISIPDSVTHIGSGAFWGCSSIVSIELPHSLLDSEGNTFYGVPPEVIHFR